MGTKINKAEREKILRKRLNNPDPDDVVLLQSQKLFELMVNKAPVISVRIDRESYVDIKEIKTPNQSVSLETLQKEITDDGGEIVICETDVTKKADCDN